MTSKTITRAEAQTYLAAVLEAEIAGIEESRWAEGDDLCPLQWSTIAARERTEAAALRLVAQRGMGATLLAQDMDRLRENGFTPPDMGETTRAIFDYQDTLKNRDFTGVTPTPTEHFSARSLTDADLGVLRRHAMDARAQALELYDRMAAESTEAHSQPIILNDAMPAPETGRYDADILALEKQRTERERARKQKGATKKGQTSDLRSFEKEADRRLKILAQFVELTGKSKLTNLTQEDLAFYRDCLDRIPKNYNKSPADRALPIDRILERGDDLPTHQVGLSAASINRNFGFLKRVIEQGALAGLSPATPVNIGILRETEGLQREARLAFSQEDIKRIFAHPYWQGRRSAKRMNQPGNEIVKDALYWMPLLGCYTGCRREELAGMKVEDVKFDHPIPYFDIRPNPNRGLKNAQSERLVPIHPHLLELGFPEYVMGYISNDESDLFPDLRPTNTDSTSFGDALHYRWSKILEHTLGSNADRKVFHSFRHYVSTYLQNVLHANSLVTKDILGHLAGDITSDRYRDSAPLEEKMKVIRELPRVF